MRAQDLYRIAGGIIVGLTILLGVLAAIQMLSTTPLWSEKGAAWVQAIGSIAAILAAIWISWNQNQIIEAQSKKRELEELRALLEILRIEIRTNLDALMTHVGPKLEANQHGGALAFEYPVPDDPVGIFSTLLPKIGTIYPVSLRTVIVETGQACSGLAQNFKTNNGLVLEWMRLQRKSRRTNNSHDLFDEKEAFDYLKAYGPAVRSQWVVTK